MVGLRYDFLSLCLFGNFFENAVRSFDMWVLWLIIKVSADIIYRPDSTTNSWMKFQRPKIVLCFSYVAILKVKLMLIVKVGTRIR